MRPHLEGHKRTPAPQLQEFYSLPSGTDERPDSATTISFGPSVECDADRLDDGAPSRHLRLEELSKFLGRGACGHVAGFRELVPHRSLRQHDVGIGADLANDLGWCPRRNKQRLRRYDLVAGEMLGDGWHIRSSRVSSGTGAGQDTNLARARVRQQCAAAEIAI